MALHLITGYAGQEHITSADQGAYNMATYGDGQFVCERGSKFAVTIASNNSLTIADGEAMMQGRYIKLPIGTTESVTIDNGSSGMKRKDLICIRYTKDSGTGVESAAFVVIKGTPAASNPSDPSYTEGDITDGNDLVNDFPLYRVNLDGLNIDSIDTLFETNFSMTHYSNHWDTLYEESGLQIKGSGTISKSFSSTPQELKEKYIAIVLSVFDTNSFVCGSVTPLDPVADNLNRLVLGKATNFLRKANYDFVTDVSGSTVTKTTYYLSDMTYIQVELRNDVSPRQIDIKFDSRMSNGDAIQRMNKVVLQGIPR